MERIYNLYQVDSFTKEKFTGNPAGVITDADGLTDIEMQNIARELNNSETAFIFTSHSRGYDVHVRFFTPTSEVPICGHATIAAHYVRAVENNLETTRVYQKTGAGVLPVDVVKEEDDYKIIMTQGKIEFGNIITGENRKKLLLSLGLSEKDIRQDCKIQIVSTGHSKVMIGINDLETLNSLKPDCDSLSKLSRSIGCNGYYVFVLDNKEDDVLVHGRMFAPAIGINEDPVTGNANGPLGAYLVHYNLVKHNKSSFKFKAKQGEAINRMGIIEVIVKIEDEEPIEVKVAGNAQIIFKSHLILE